MIISDAREMVQKCICGTCSKVSSKSIQGLQVTLTRQDRLALILNKHSHHAILRATSLQSNTLSHHRTSNSDLQDKSSPISTTA